MTRSKDNIKWRCVKRRIKKTKGKILRDDEVLPEKIISREKYPKRLRFIRALVERDGKEVEMEFITNGLRQLSQQKYTLN